MFVNVVTFPPIVEGKEAEFEEWFRWSNELYQPFDGFVSRRLLKSLDDGTYLGIVEHESRETFMAMHTSVERELARKKVDAVFDGSPKPRFYELVVSSGPEVRA